MSIIVKQHNKVCQISFNRPDKKNAITLAMYQQVADAINRSVEEGNVKVIVISGEGEHFTSGNDLKDFLANPNIDESSSVYQFLKALIFCPIPVIAAVKGFAIGVGTTMLLHCERVFSDETAQFALPFVNLGLVPEACSSMLLPSLVGYQQAAHLLLTGGPFSAQEALDMGFSSELAVYVDEVALDYAAKLAQKPRRSLIDTKALLRRDIEGMKLRLKAELELFSNALKSDEANEAITAFLQKRPANFENF